jgi:uncharacterized membrane protein HdeD (DUF308 family)
MRNPAEISVAVCVFIGIAFLIGGLAMLITWLVNRSGGQGGFVSSSLYAIIGAALAAFGGFIWLNPTAILDFVIILFALVILIHAIYEITAAVALRSIGDSGWYFSVIGSIIKLILAFMIIAQPFSLVKYIMLFAGISLIVTGVMGIVQMFRLSRAARRFKKAVLETEKTASAGQNVIDGELLSDEEVQDDDR